MSAPHEFFSRTLRTSGAKLLALTLVVLSVLVLGSTALLGVLLIQQTRQLNASVQETRQLMDANLRPLTQVQRGLLRLIALIEREEASAADLEQERGFISERTLEASLPALLHTLGSEALLQTSLALRDRWVNVVEPLASQITAAPASASSALRAETIAALEALERDYNQLISDSENNRRLHSVALNESARSTLNTAALLLAVLAASVAAFLSLSAVAGFGFYRLMRQRESAVEALLRANRDLRKLSAVASHTKNLVILTDAEGRIEWVNNAFVAHTGYTLSELRGQRPTLLQGPNSDPATLKFMYNKFAAGESVEAELVNYARDGREYWVAIEARPTFDDQGTLTSFVVLETDVTARKQTEAALRTALEQERELREMKSRFVIMTSHEFRTPLTTILSIASFLKMAEADLSATKRADRLTRLENAAQHIEALIEDVLAYDQTDTAWLQFEAQPVDLAAMTRELVEVLRVGAGARHHFACDLPDGALMMQADRKLLAQMLSNLLSNAVKYSAAGSTVEVTLRHEVGRVLLRVRDQGIGIPASEQKRIFEPFFRAGNTGGVAGTGLGLSILRNAVELHGGQVQFESAEGEGSTFTVLLPAEPTAEMS
jgi:PAS domain S-box-containing protein